MIKLIKNKKRYYILISLLLIVPGIIFAAPELNVTWPASPGTGIVFEVGMPLHYLVAYLFAWGITLGGLAAFIALLIAGAQYLTSAGAPEKMTEAQNKIKKALIGLALLLSSFIILDTINPHLVALEAPPRIEDIIRDMEIITPAEKFLLPPCERVTIFRKTNFEGDSRTIYLKNCQPKGDPGKCLVYREYPFGWPPRTYFRGSIKFERQARDEQGYIIPGKWNTNCFCEFNVYDDHCGDGWGHFLATVSSAHTDLAMIALAIDPVDRGTAIVGIDFVKSPPGKLYVSETVISGFVGRLGGRIGEREREWRRLGEIQIKNIGRSDLSWHKAISGLDWIKIVPGIIGGDLAPGGTTNIRLYKKTYDLNPGSYQGTITFTADSPAEGSPQIVDVWIDIWTP